MLNAELSKKEKVIAAAVQLFVTQGFDKVSTADISKAAGVATGTMFHHFASKDEIIIAAYRAAKQSFISQTIHQEAAGSVREDLQLMWYKLVDWALSNPDQFHYMRQFSNSPYYNKEIMAGDNTWLGLLDWWKKGISHQQIKDIPIDFLIKLFSSLLYSTIEYLMLHPAQREEYLTHSFRLCWDMIGTPIIHKKENNH